MIIILQLIKSKKSKNIVNYVLFVIFFQKRRYFIYFAINRFLEFLVL